MQPLNLPAFNAKIREDNGKHLIFDVIRKKYVALTPEEWVRQHFIHYMIGLKYPASMLAVEKLVIVNGMKQRADIVLYNKSLEPALIVECKSPVIDIDNEVIEQVARYNITLKVSFLVVTNGLKNFCIKIDRKSGDFQTLNELPTISELNSIKP